MKKIRFLFILVFCLSFFNVTAFANEHHINQAIFIGEIKNVEEDREQNNIRLLADGYIKGNEIYKEQILIIVGEDTKIISCNGEKADNVKFEKGDKIYVQLSEAMTKSIPPQSFAKKIQVSKNVK